MPSVTQNAARDEVRPLLPLWQRVGLLTFLALLWMALAPLPTFSERFHTILPLLWAANFRLSGQRLDKRTSAYGAGIGLGIVFYLLGSVQSHQIGARFTFLEALNSLYFTLGLFVIYGALCTVLEAPLRQFGRSAALLASPRGWWLRLLRMAVALLIFAPYLYTAFNLHRFKYATASDPRQAFGLAFENVTLQSRDGVTLRGWFLPAARSETAVLLVHGVGSNRGDVLSVAQFLHRVGFAVFAFDLRGHGDSSGHTTSFGVYEARDVEAAAAYLRARPGVRRVAVYAFSMGGSAVLHAVGDNGLPGVRSFILDSTFAEFEPLAREQMAFLPDSVARPLLAIISFCTRLELGVGLRDIAPRRFIGRIAPRPLLLIHGSADTLIPPIQARWNFAAAQAPKQLYLIPGANHCEGWRVAAEDYEKRVVSFLRERGAMTSKAPGSRLKLTGVVPSTSPSTKTGSGGSLIKRMLRARRIVTFGCETCVPLKTPGKARRNSHRPASAMVQMSNRPSST